MTTQEINEAIGILSRNSWEMEFQYEENGGEVTPELEAMEAENKALRELLTTEGVDSLGRWLKAKQDEIAAAKAEKAAADARVKSLQRTETYIKDKIADLLIITGQEKVKGSYYSFAQSESVRTSVNMDSINEEWLGAVTDAARSAGLPDWMDVAIVTNATRMKDREDAAAFLNVETSPSVRFTKPRAVKE